MTHQYSKDLDGLEPYQDYEDVISLKEAKKYGEKLAFSPQGLLNGIEGI
jgi:hypothetical protein